MPVSSFWTTDGFLTGFLTTFRLAVDSALLSVSELLLDPEPDEAELAEQLPVQNNKLKLDKHRKKSGSDFRVVIWINYKVNFYF